jgi:hypothetical protein
MIKRREFIVKTAMGAAARIGELGKHPSAGLDDRYCIEYYLLNPLYEKTNRYYLFHFRAVRMPDRLS